MRRKWRGGRLGAVTVLVVAATAALAVQGVTASAIASRSGTPGLGYGSGFGKVGDLDCNGLSPIQKPLRATMDCADPRGSASGRFYENGHYIGHDEPSVRYISYRPGSGNDVSFTETLPTDPVARPTVAHPGNDVTHWFELSGAPWFSMDVCDPNSAPLIPCTVQSDANAPKGNYPGAGAAFVELQFYPPGFAPFADNTSCDNTHWCSALNIDSLECTGNGSGPCNPNCVEPVNFSFIQTNGVPTGPPSPQKSNLQTVTPNAHTLLMKPGDRITVQMFDAPIPGGHALEAKETDLTTGQSGFMIASARNGFMNTDPFTCDGTPFNFEPEYSTARPQNIIPWGVGPYMINSEFEIGHFEACTQVRGRATVTIGKFKDTYFTQCLGPYEKGKDSVNAFEPDDSPCYKAGDTHGGTTPPNLVTGCDVFIDAIGDLDFDGSPYYPDWPSSTTAGTFPTPFLQQQPTTVGGAGYPLIQFMTDSSATQFNTNCNLVSGSGCVLPPKGPGHFYPFFTLAQVGGQCVWEFGNMSNGDSFGQDGQYGSVGPNTIGAFAGQIRRNPHCSA
jgi:hypothetical protein